MHFTAVICSRCGPDRDCSGCKHKKPLRLRGERAVLIVSLLGHIFPKEIVRTQKEIRALRRIKRWMVRCNGWSYMTLPELKEELKRFMAHEENLANKTEAELKRKRV